MTYPISSQKIHFQVNSLLNHYGIEAKLDAITNLVEIMQKSLAFNQKLYDIGTLEGVSLATSVEALMEIFVLRSRVYQKMGYGNEFPETIKGLNFDKYDESSAIVYTKREVITGTCRLIFDSKKKLPIDAKYTLDSLRAKSADRGLVEASRVIIENIEGLKPEFRLLTIDAYKILASYNLNAVSVMTEEHIKLYKKFGGLSIEKSFQGYGTLENEFFLTLWDTSKISPFFRKIFLQNRKAV